MVICGTESRIYDDRVSPVERSEEGRLLVLLVDDDPDIRRLFAMLIAKRGHDVVEACDAEDALILFEVRPHLALIDIGLPGMDGYHLARLLRGSEAGRQSFLVAVTGWTGTHDRVRAREAGFDDCAPKPLRRGRLSEILRAAGERVGCRR